MKVATVDLTKLEQAVQTLTALSERRKAAGDKDNELYYGILAEQFRRVATAKEEGKPLVAHTLTVPTEIFYAMDVVPMSLEGVSSIVANLARMDQQAFQAASSWGFKVEICSVHRLVNGTMIEGLLPHPDGVIWTNQVCDNTTKGGDLVVEACGCPGFFLDRPYYSGEIQHRYFLKQLEEMVKFLERLTGKRMDWDRLAEIMEISRRSLELWRQIFELRKTVPCPASNRLFWYLFGLHSCAGSQEYLDYLQWFRDDLKAKADQGLGSVSNENYRLISFMNPPTYLYKLLDWMAKEFRAVIVSEPWIAICPEDVKFDHTKPLESLVTKYLNHAPLSPFHTSLARGNILQRTIREVRDFKVDGALYWAHVSCRTSNPLMKMVKDTMTEKSGVPTVVLDVDNCDPTYTTEEKLKDTLEGFFEMLEAR